MTLNKPIPAAQLLSMQKDVARLMPDTCVLQSQVITNDGRGGIVRSYVVQGTYPCRVDPLPKKGKLELFEMSEKLVIDYILSLPAGTTIDVHWQVVTGGQTYEIVMLANQQSWAVAVRAYISRVK